MLQWMDDFSSYGSNDSLMLNGLYATNSGNLSVDPDPSGSGAIVWGVGGNIVENAAALRKVLSSGQTTVGVAARYWLSNLSGSSSRYPNYCVFTDSSNSVHCRVSLDPSGFLEAYNSDGTLIGRSDDPVMITNGWVHVETKCVFDFTAGSVEVRIEGVTKLLATGVKTANVSGGTCQNVKVSSVQEGDFNFYLKDYIIWDGTGTVNNDFMGSCIVYKIIPDSDVSLNWTPSTGTTGFNLLNESPPDDDAGYLAAGNPAPSPAEFTMTDVPDDTTSVRGVIAFHRSRKTDGGDGNEQTALIYSGNSSTGSDRPITTAWTYWFDIHDLAPDGGNWSKVKIDATDINIDRTV